MAGFAGRILDEKNRRGRLCTRGKEAEERFCSPAGVRRTPR
jgi:hypothetical protein